MKRGAELSTDRHLVESRIYRQGRRLERPGRPKCIVGICCERLVEPAVKDVFNSHFWEKIGQIWREARDIEFTWSVSYTSIIHMAVQTCNSKIPTASCGGNP